MNIRLTNIVSIGLIALILAGCRVGEESDGGLFSPGGGEPPNVPSTPSPEPTPGGNTPNPSPTPGTTPNPNPPELTTFSIQTTDAEAFEQENDLAKLVIRRDRTESNQSVAYAIAGGEDPEAGIASSEDFELRYAEGGVVGNRIEFNTGQSQRVIEVQALADDSFETPEILRLNLVSEAGYSLAEENHAEVVLADAQNLPQNAKVLIGVFTPQDGATTPASGTASVIVSGDNRSAQVNYTFFNLSSDQTDQHIHLAPSGTVIQDIEQSGPLSGYLWDLAPGGIFTTRQQLIDALFGGELYVNIHSSNYPAGEITATFVFDEEIDPPTETPLSPEDIDRDIVRFLNQATFGATPEDYALLRSQINTDGGNRLQVYEAWIEAQIAQPASSLLAATDFSMETFPGDQGYRSRRDAFWLQSVYGKDQLRQKTAYALSQILVVSESLKVLRDAHRGLADYWDTLGEHAFGEYRELLTDVAQHPVMGVWLSHIRNRKADPEAGYSPDENFAREIMQLFSFGLLQRQTNGRVRLGSDGLPMPTYSNDVIQEMARVFTGLSFAVFEEREAPFTIIENTRFGRGNQVFRTQAAWLQPMKFFPEHHDFGEKRLFTDGNTPTIIAASDSESAEAAQAEFEQVIRAIVAHSSTAPNIARLLIKRFVTSNPSADYIEDVATAFGEEGDLRATIKAILLHPEARNPDVINSDRFGKQKEPVLIMTSLMRLLEAHSDIALAPEEGEPSWARISDYREAATFLRIGNLQLRQRPLDAPTVFNFFLPDYSPPGELALNALTAPELQINDESSMYSAFNTYSRFASDAGFWDNSAFRDNDFTRDQVRVTLDRRHLVQLWSSTEGDVETKATAIVDFLDFYLASGQLKASGDINTRLTMIDAIANASEQDRYNLAIYSATTSPLFVLQR